MKDKIVIVWELFCTSYPKKASCDSDITFVVAQNSARPTTGTALHFDVQ